MSIVRLGISLAIVASIAASAQQAPTRKHSPVRSIVIDRSRPYVYLEVEQIGARSPIRQDEPRVGVFLRLHNNCTVPIILATFGGSESRPNEVGVLDTVVANQVQDEPVMTISQLPPMSSEDSPTKTGERLHQDEKATPAHLRRNQWIRCQEDTRRSIFVH